MDPTQAPIQNPIEQSTPTTGNKVTGRTKAALWLMIGPTVLLILAFLLFAIINWAFASTAPASTADCVPATGSSSITGSNGITVSNEDACVDELFGESPAPSTISNVILFIFGTIGALTWLPGLIIGIVLLATRPVRQ